MSDTGSILRAEREKRNMSMGEFAAYLGVSKQNISMYESGKRSPKVSIAAKIAEKLGMSIEQLAGFEPVEEERRIKKNQVDRISQLVNQLSPDEIRQAESYLEFLLSKR